MERVLGIGGHFMRRRPGPRAQQFSFAAFYRDYLIREFILRQSFDRIAERNGWKFHIDGVHLNTRGGLILTDTVQAFLDLKNTH